MKILFVCQQYIHAARWINQLKDSNHEVYVFDCLDAPIHPELLWTNYITNWSKRKLPYFKGEYKLEKKALKLFQKIEPFLKVTASEKLLEIIDEIKPDLVHSLEMQSETYPLLKVRNKVSFNWAYFSWGSDLYLYQNKSYHKNKMVKILTKLNFLFVDNTRDIALAKKMNFKGEVCGVFPGGGGYDLTKLVDNSIEEERKLIIIKGYDHWAGRARVVLKALTLIVDEIKEFDIYVYSAHDNVVDEIKEINDKFNLNIKYSSRYQQISHDELIEKFNKALIAIGNNLSDGIPNTLLEAIICGAFPIQSNPGRVTEDYIEHKKNGLLINNPENPIEIADHIKYAITNKKMLKNAFKINRTISKKIDYVQIKNKVLNVYDNIENQL